MLEWARENVASTLCACLATHATVKHFHAVERIPLPIKRWGVYSHKVIDRKHPLVRNINTRFDVPHSRWNELTHAQLERAGVHVLVESVEGGVHLAVSEDRFRFVYFQGHPEYDRNSLLKEYKREIGRYLNGELATYPPHPEHYFPEPALAILEAFRERALEQCDPELLAEFPESQVMPWIDNTWGDSGKIVVNNWLGLVYQVTNQDRRIPFMPDVNPDDPLKLRSR